MKRRLLVAKAMVHSPPILVLDEPTAGVDVELRRQLWDYVRRLHADGVTIVLTTHYLEEAEELCDRIAIINHGRVIANEPTRELVVESAGESGRRHLRPRHRTGADQRLLREYRAGRRTHAGDHIPQGPGECRRGVERARGRRGLSIVDVSTRDPDLEDVFLSLIGGAQEAA